MSAFKYGYGRSEAARSPEYRIWSGIIYRCKCPSCPAFRLYGGRGISICPEWRHSFVSFLKYVGRRPSPKHSIDRINNDGNYEPGNVRWATQKQQARNSRAAKLLTFNGESLSISEWAERLGMVVGSLQERLYLGWSIEKALTTPIGTLHGQHRLVTFNGKTQCISHWCRDLNLKLSTVYNRLNKWKWSLEKTFGTPARPKREAFRYMGMIRAGGRGLKRRTA